jgi:hypothetical protein
MVKEMKKMMELKFQPISMEEHKEEKPDLSQLEHACQI